MDGYENHTNTEGIPLVVDLDGTLIRTDTLHESAIRAVRANILVLFFLPFTLRKGTAYLKRFLASRTPFNPQTLPYREEFLQWLHQQKNCGRKIVLCTAADLMIAQAVADHLALFDEVLASDGSRNISGPEKARVLVDRFGLGGFDYAGNAVADIPVWQSARRAVVVNAPERLGKQVRSAFDVEREFVDCVNWRVVLFRMVRLHQWLKNILLFVPLFAAHRVSEPALWGALVLAFFAFGLCASATYIGNDLLDLEADRQHPRKRERPFASGKIPVWVGCVLAPAGVLLGFLLATCVNTAFGGWVACYFIITLSYSLFLKSKIVVDCITLSLLYALRIAAGAAAIEMSMTFWIAAFSLFLFLSLAFVKRYAELVIRLDIGEDAAPGRGYRTSDLPLLQTMGVISGYLSVLVLCLYINSPAVTALYKTPELVWAAVPVFLFWVSWIWLQAHRGQMHDDPVIFAIKDRYSLLAGVCFMLIIGLGAVGIPW